MLNNVRVGTRLLFMNFIAVALMLVMFGAGYWGMTRMKNQSDRIVAYSAAMVEPPSVAAPTPSG